MNIYVEVLKFIIVDYDDDYKMCVKWVFVKCECDFEEVILFNLWIG